MRIQRPLVGCAEGAAQRREARAAAGKHVIFLDAYNSFVRDTNWKTKLMYDNLHPNDAGYVALGRMWYGAIKGVLPTGP